MKIHEILYGETDDGKHFAASLASPAFLFCEATREAARATAERALSFYSTGGRP